MSNYGKVDVKVWGDAKFRRLSPLQPSGQALWLYLLAPRERGKIPGVICAWEVSLAKNLNWPLRAFQEKFQELLDMGMVLADLSAPLIWLPNSIRYNAPPNPNVIRGWRAEWESLPECSLKAKAWAGLKGFVEGLGIPFAKAFLECLLEPFPEPLPEGYANTGTGTGTGTGTVPPIVPHGKKRVGEERELEEQARDVLSWLNLKAGKNFRPVEANLSLVRARIQSGILPAQLKAIAGKKAQQWKGTEQEQYLRPATLFNKTKCEQYIGELPAPKGSDPGNGKEDSSVIDPGIQSKQTEDPAHNPFAQPGG